MTSSLSRVQKAAKLIVFLALTFSLFAQDAPQLIQNPSFENGGDGSTSIPSWSGDLKRGLVKVVKGDDGKNALSLRCDAELVTAKGGVGVRQDFKLDAGWKRLMIKTRARVIRFTPGKEGWQEPRVFVMFRDAAGKHIGGYPGIISLRTVAGWKNFEKEVAIPDGAATGSLAIECFVSESEFEVTDLSLTPIIPSTNSADAALPAGAKLFWDDEPVETQSATRSTICLNGLWKFSPAQSAEPPKNGYGYIWVPGAWHNKIGTLPGIASFATGPEWKELPAQHNAAAWGQVGRAWYRRTLLIPAAWNGRQVFLNFNRVCTDAEIFINGKPAGRVIWPWGEVDITSHVKPGDKVELAVLVAALLDKTELTEFTGTAADQIFKKKIELDARGITGDVFLSSRPMTARVSDVFVKPSTRKGSLGLDVEISGLNQSGDLSFTARLLDEKGNVEKTFTAAAKASSQATQVLSLAFPWADARLWELGDPAMYTLMLKAEGPGISDEYAQRFGFREFWVDGTKFFLNNKEVRLRPRIAGVNEADRSKVSVELIDGSIAGMKAMGGNVQEFWPWDHWQRGTVRFHELWYDRADITGWGLIADFGSMRGFAERWDENPSERTEWERLLRDEMRRVRNHPSILMWIHSPNRFGNGQDQNPLVIGNRAALDSMYDGSTWDKGTRKAVAGALKANETIRALDPTRPVTTHQGGLAGDVHTVNNYPSWQPLQEQEEWLGPWLAKGDMPFISIEFGFFPPCDFRRGRNSWQGSVRSELLQTEYLAAYFGNKAYETESPATRAWNPANLVKGQDYAYPNKGGFYVHDPMTEEMVFLMGLNVYRSWRTAGITGGMLQWEHNHGFDDQVRVDGKAIYAERRPITGPFLPGRRGAYVSNASAVEQYWLTPPGAATRRGGEFWDIACQATMAWITGKDIPGDSMAFTAKDRHFATGSTVEKRISILNDSRRDESFDMEWKAVAGGKEIGKGNAAGKITVSETRFLPLAFKLPAVTEKTDGIIKLRGRIGTNAHRDSFAFRVYPAEARSVGTIKIFDPAGLTAKLLTGLGYRVTAWDGKPGDALVVVGRDALSPENKLPGSLSAHVTSGGRLMVFSQNEKWLSEAAGFRIGHQVLRRAFPVSATHPVCAGLDEADMQDFSGTGTFRSVETNLAKWRTGGTPRWGWFNGSRGSVSSVPVEKPHAGAWRPILEADFDLAYSPLMELDYGKGRVTLCQLDLEDHVLLDPAAEKLARQSISWALNAPLSPRVTAVYLGGNHGAELLTSLGLDYVKRDRIGADTVMTVVGESAQITDQELEAAAQKGSRIIILAHDGDSRFGLSWNAPEAFSGSPAVPAWPETAGLSASDLRVRAPVKLSVMKQANGFEIAASGFLARKVIGKGSIILSALNPGSFDADTLTYLRLTRWRTTRAVSQLLANAGGRFASDNAFFAFEGGNVAAASELSLIGPWKGLQTHRIPNTKDGQPAPDDPGISDAARAAIAETADESATTPVNFPAAFEDAGGIWTDYDGEAVFRKTVVVPPAWAGKDLDLSLGVIDDFDDTYWNGEKIGSTGKSQKEWWTFHRKYTVPGRQVKAGTNVIAVRIFDNYRNGGIMGPSSAMLLAPVVGTSGVRGWYVADYRKDFPLGDDPHRYYRW